MKTKKQHWTYHFGKTKGFVLTLDMLIAATILIIVIAFTTYISANTAEDKLAIIQPSYIISDAINFLDNNQTLQTKNPETIENALNTMVPASFSYRIQITYSKSSTAIDIGNEIQKGVFVSTGKHYFYSGNNELGIVRYWIWPKQ